MKWGCQLPVASYLFDQLPSKTICSELWLGRFYGNEQTKRDRPRGPTDCTHSRDCLAVGVAWHLTVRRRQGGNNERGNEARSARIGAPVNCCLNLHFKLVSNSAAELSSGTYTYTAEDKHTHITHTCTHTRAETEGDSIRKAKVSRSTPFHFQGRVIDIRLSRTHYTHVGQDTHTDAHTHTNAYVQRHTLKSETNTPNPIKMRTSQTSHMWPENAEDEPRERSAVSKSTAKYPNMRIK